MFLPTVWGSETPLRPFEPQMRPIGEVRPTARWAYSRRRGGVVQLEHGLPADSPYLPAQSLVPHYCGRGLRLGVFSEWLAGAIDQQAPGLGGVLVSYIKDGPATPPPQVLPPEKRRGIGIRRGLGKRPPSNAADRLREATKDQQTELSPACGQTGGAFANRYTRRRSRDVGIPLARLTLAIPLATVGG